ncbi:hypothetical protein PCC6912_51250 [Chlorogloeopsis fritschii PCC 6912]|uniref:Uncharacterized protein n=1 Tax=Chlorogloeopsis fritschii PCC 6912 TaxID=211165 RepID=A0A3S1AB82_CHLFR|nr:hypothetical protein PCC6912_51250 [Chlorogloeopsis fritschii PCC 6912]
MAEGKKCLFYLFFANKRFMFNNTYLLINNTKSDFKLPLFQFSLKVECIYVTVGTRLVLSSIKVKGITRRMLV